MWATAGPASGLWLPAGALLAPGPLKLVPRTPVGPIAVPLSDRHPTPLPTPTPRAMDSAPDAGAAAPQRKRLVLKPRDPDAAAKLEAERKATAAKAVSQQARGEPWLGAQLAGGRPCGTAAHARRTGQAARCQGGGGRASPTRKSTSTAAMPAIGRRRAPN